MGLLPLEFTDCLTDSPYFRDNLTAHEKEVDRTSQAVKGIIRDIKELLAAARNLSRAQRNLANTFQNFSFECIGNSQTDDEIVIAGSLKEFGRLLGTVEDERDRIVDNAQLSFIEPLENFRKEHIGAAKEEKKKFDKETIKFCQSLERHLNMSTKKTENHLQEADATLEMEQRHFIQASLDYVLRLQEVHESKKFEFVERILLFMSRWLTFYHQGYEVCMEFKSFMRDLTMRLQRTKVNFDATNSEAAQLKNKMLSKLQDPGSLNKMYTRQGYLFLMEKKALGTTWNKHFCQYQKDTKKFAMIAFSQTTGKILASETITIQKCLLRNPDTIDKRFCFDIIVSGKPGLYTFQALSEKDYKLWLDAMDGKEPSYAQLGRTLKQEDYMLDEVGFGFVKQCIDAIESRGLQDQGLYRLVGVNSKVNKLISLALDQARRSEKLNLKDNDEWETKTITSALKTYFRNLPEPLMTFKLHGAFLAAAKQENRVKRINDIHALVQFLPRVSYQMLEILTKHLWKVSQSSDKNLMTVSNLGVCFGPTLLRPEEETMASIMDIKFCNVTVEVIVDNQEVIFSSNPPPHEATTPVKRESTLPPVMHSQSMSAMPPPEIRHQQMLSPRADPGLSPKEITRQTSQPSLIQAHHANQRSSTNSKFWPEGRGPTYQNLSHPPFTTSPQSVSYANNTSTTSLTSAGSSNGGTQSPGARINRQQLPAYISNPLWQDSSLPSSNVSSNNGTPDLSPVSHGRNIPPQGLLYAPQKQPLPSSATHQIAQTHHMRPSQGQNYGTNNIPPPQVQIPGRYQNELRSPTFHKQLLPGNGASGRKVRTLFACVGENELELTFKPNEIIYDVRKSQEHGWLEGCLNGRIGLVPENYVEFIT